MMKKTLHLQQRQSQRCVPNAILDLVYIFGESLNENELFFSRKSALKARSELMMRHCSEAGDSALDSNLKIENIFFDQKNTKRSKTKWKTQKTKGDLITGIESLEKYVGLKLILAGEVAITCYRCRKKQMKKASRLHREKFVH